MSDTWWIWVGAAWLLSGPAITWWLLCRSSRERRRREARSRLQV